MYPSRRTKRSHRLSEADLEHLLSRGNLKRAGETPAKTALQQLAPGKPNKMRNQRIAVNGEAYDSKKEYQRHCDLLMLERAGAVIGLRRQVAFEIAPPVVLSGRKKPALRYTADFVYQERGTGLVVEDVKSPASRDTAYMIRKHLMMSVHGIEIKET